MEEEEEHIVVDRLELVGNSALKEESSKPHTETIPPVRKTSKRGRKPAKIDVKAKLERSRQSARECRARKKLRYQYLEELVSNRERAIYALREELEMYRHICKNIDQGKPVKLPNSNKTSEASKTKHKCRNNHTQKGDNNESK